MSDNESVERVAAWQCIGCGRIEGAQPCIGICRDRKAEFVDAADYDRLAAEAAALRKVAREIATITPPADEWERSYKALQARARRILQGHPDHADAA
jgi:hypothetical protein